MVAFVIILNIVVMFALSLCLCWFPCLCCSPCPTLQVPPVLKAPRRVSLSCDVWSRAALAALDAESPGLEQVTLPSASAGFSPARHDSLAATH